VRMPIYKSGLAATTFHDFGDFWATPHPVLADELYVAGSCLRSGASAVPAEVIPC